ncbi:UNVERIFIED_CONTAM: hypothetical protein K2H54_034894 [Gekko kuhli]
MSGEEGPELPVTTEDQVPTSSTPQEHCLTKLLDATFDGMPEKLAFFMVPVEKFVMYWSHLFLTEECRMDYIALKLQDGVADWYISLHNMQGPELYKVDEFMWALHEQYKDPMESEKAHNDLHALKQGHAAKVQEWPDGVLAEQYHLGLHPEIQETILRSVHSVALNA